MPGGEINKENSAEPPESGAANEECIIPNNCALNVATPKTTSVATAIPTGTHLDL